MSPFEDLCNDRLQVIKQDGTELPVQRGSVSKNLITLLDANQLLEAGDTVRRLQSNGQAVDYVVDDPGFHEDFHGTAAHYQAKVRLEGALPAAKGPMHVYLNGGNSNRVNIGSTDNSVNIVHNGPSVFDKLRTAAEGLPSEQRADAVARIDALEHAHGTPSFAESWTQFIGFTADHLGVFGSLMPLVAQLMAG